MKFSNYNYWHVVIGVIAASLPFIALGTKFGAENGLLIFIVFVSCLLVAKLVIYLFTRRSKLARGTAIAMHGNLIFLLFLPGHLREEINKLEESEKPRSD